MSCSPTSQTPCCTRAKSSMSNFGFWPCAWKMVRHGRSTLTKMGTWTSRLRSGFRRTSRRTRKLLGCS
ncbi:unnamed protein product [Polarella glacialis]|uniref:Uncharacterized protein n=1 Tax=Polarella glacialis TaxID=89957 RepID=A0A813EE71_POLGL|nr:unnamed protein product [Polarella glacialis]CAE8611239.1 unnamed protein product [Polarella glacialis]